MEKTLAPTRWSARSMVIPWSTASIAPSHVTSPVSKESAADNVDRIASMNMAFYANVNPKGGPTPPASQGRGGFGEFFKRDTQHWSMAPRTWTRKRTQEKPPEGGSPAFT